MSLMGSENSPVSGQTAQQAGANSPLDCQQADYDFVG
jgi:hypothetical protein